MVQFCQHINRQNRAIPLVIKAACGRRKRKRCFMPFIEITSADNAELSAISKLKMKKYRAAESRFTVEGSRAVCEAFAAAAVRTAVVTRTFYENHPELLEMLGKTRTLLVTERAFARLSDTVSPQGILATLDMFTPPKRPFKDYYVYLDGISDPGNAGTIIRTAHAFGMGGVIFSPGSVDVYSGKVIRSTLGSIFHTDIYTDAARSFLEDAQRDGYRIISTALSEKSESVFEMKTARRTIFVIGSEANGVSGDILSISDGLCKIPMPGGAESLNAAVAAALVMAEAVRRN